MMSDVWALTNFVLSEGDDDQVIMWALIDEIGIKISEL